MPPEERAEDPLVGQIIGGRYRITGVLGEGGMGIVYVGEQQMGSTIRKVAVKTLHSHLSKDPSVMARFHRECGTVAQLEHPNTIKFYDFGATPDGTLYIAMEFVSGDSLASVIEKQGALAPDRIIKIMRQICGALEEAHQQGIVHRDLKPENVILTVRAGETDFVKVLDFGIAARTESTDAKKEQKLTQQGMVLGTPPYMSPEQFTGKELDRRSDVYSLGVMAYEMLTGRLPFDADTPWQWATQHMTAQPTPFETVAPASSAPEPMRRAILRALSKDREERQATAKDFFAELSGGGGVTVDDMTAATSGAHTSTAAMPAAPDFFAAPAAPAGPYAAPQPMMMAPAASAGPVAPAMVAPPPVRPSSGGGAGLVLGLVAAAAVLLAAIGVVAYVGLRRGADDGETLTIPIDSTTEQSTTLPFEPMPEAGEVPSASSAVAGSGGAPSAGVGGGGTSRPGPGPAPAPDAGQAPPTGGAEACAQCLAAAQGGNVQGAAGYYARCSDAAQKERCGRAARSGAANAANAAALNGNCDRARAIVNAASSMGQRVPMPGKCK